jgi:hypothetical protein
MLSRAAECACLSLIVERWLDADLLLAQEGEALLAEIAAARRALEGGEMAACRRHTRQFIFGVEALLRSGQLVEQHGRPALAAARRLLVDAAG